MIQKWKKRIMEKEEVEEEEEEQKQKKNERDTLMDNLCH